MKISMAVKSLLGAAALALPLMASAESNVQSNASPLTVTARVNFSIVVAKTLYLRVGPGSSYTTGVLAANSNTPDPITFTPSITVLGNGTAVTGTGGDLTNGVETAAIVSNGGTVSLVANATGALSNGTATIPYTQITTTASAGTFPTLLNAPTLANGASNTITLTPVPATGVVLADAKWSYAYANTAVVAPGTYGATAANNGIVTYTATMP